MTMKLALSTGYVGQMEPKIYDTVCLMIDAWFHVYRGVRAKWINYPAFALYLRNKIVCDFGVRGYETDDIVQDDVKYLDRNGELTKFTIHNVLYHMLLDMEQWGNMNICGCKHLEKSNKDTKESLRRGAVAESYCNRIGLSCVNVLKLQYLLEGGRVDDHGNMDPYNGKHKVDESILRKLSNAKAITIFHHMKYNPYEPQYRESYRLGQFIKQSNWYNNHHPAVMSKIYDTNWISQAMKLLDIRSESSMDVDSTQIDDDDDEEEEEEGKIRNVQFWSEITIWRRQKAIKLSSGSLIVKKHHEDHSRGPELLLVTGFGEFTRGTSETIAFVIGHVVNRLTWVKPDTNVAAYVNPELDYWFVDDILAKAIYAHGCAGSECEYDPQNLVKKHDWKNNTDIFIFWYVGQGYQNIGNPLYEFHYDHIGVPV